MNDKMLTYSIQQCCDYNIRKKKTCCAQLMGKFVGVPTNRICLRVVKFAVTRWAVEVRWVWVTSNSNYLLLS